MPTPVIIEVKANTSQAKRELGSLSKSFSSFGSSMRSVVAMASQSVTGIRQMAQGVQNLGFTMSAMIGIPLAAGLKKIGEEAVTFEKSLVEVEKTTGLTKDQIAELGKEIRSLTLTTPTSANELAQLAAEAGRAGVGLGQTLAGNLAGARQEILEFVRVMDMMQVSTNLTGEESAKAFSRFITLFKDIDVGSIENLGSSINELGQATSVAEDEIVGAMLRIAPAAATVGMAAPDVAALATAITQMSESMSRGGTRVRVALEQMVLNYKDAAKLIGVSSSEMAERINTDALPVFLELVYAISQIEDGTMALQTATDIFGTTGANAVQRFAAAYPELLSYIELSQKAFAQGTSLQVEFDRALTSTSAAFDILKNNIIEVGLEFAQSLLPIAQEIISALIPAVQELAAFVANLSDEQKMLAVAIAGVIVVGLPLLALLGSIGFGFSMIINGAVNLIGGLAGLLATIISFGGGASLVGVILGGLASLLGVGLVIAAMKGTGAFDIILTKLQEVANGALDWGESFIAEIAEGIISGAATVLVKALEFVGNIISSFLEPGSPPETGPLSTINEWGSRLIDVYLQSFKNADFGILKDVAGIIADVFQNLVALGDMDELDFGPMLASARTFVSELISVFNKTGVISEDILSKIGSMLGGAGDEVIKLLRLQLQYNKALKELEAIRQRTSDIEEAYQAEARAIAARTDLTEVEKMQAIRAAKKRRDLSLTNAKTEQKVAEDNVDSLKEEVSWQKNYIDAMSEQDSVLVSHLKLIGKLKKAVSNLGKGIKSLADKIRDLIADLLRQLEVNKRLQELYESKGMDTTPLLRKELSLRKRLVKALMSKKLMYEDMNKDLPQEEWLKLAEEEEAMLNSNLDRIQELEVALDMDVKPLIPTIDTTNMNEGVDEIQKAVEDMLELGETVTNTLSKGQEFWAEFKAGLSGAALPVKEFDINSLGIPRGVLRTMTEEEIDSLTPVLDQSASRFYEWGQKIKEVWDKLKGTIEGIGDKFTTFKEKIVGAVDGVKDSLGIIDPDALAKLEGRLPAKEIAELTARSESLGGTFKKIVPIIAGLAGAFLLLRGPLRGLASLLVSPSTIGKAGKGFTSIKKKVASLGTWADTTSLSLKGLAKGGKGLAKTLVGGLKILPTRIGLIGIAFQDMGDTLKGQFRLFKAFPKLFAKWRLGQVFSGLIGLIKGVGGGLSGILPALASIGSAIGGAISTVGTFVASITVIGGVVLAVVAAIGAAVVYIKRNWEKFSAVFEQIWSNITGAVKGFIDNFKSALGLGEGSGRKFTDVLEDIYAKAEPVAKFLAGAFTKALQIISGLIKIILPALGKAFGGVFRGIVGVASGVLDLFGALFGLIEGVYNAIFNDGDWTFLEDVWVRIKDAALGIFGGLGTALAGVFGGAIDVILGIASSIVDGIANIFGMTDVLAKVKGFIDGVIGFFTDLWNKLIGNSIIPDIVNGIKDWFKKLIKPFQPIFDKIKEFVNYLKIASKFVKNAFKGGGMRAGLKAIYKVLGPLQKVFKPVLELIWKFYNVIRPVIDALKGGFEAGGIKGAFEALKNILPSVISQLGGLVGGMLTMIPKMLIGLAQMLWPWITETLIPWVTNVVSIVWAYLKENVPIWITTILGILGELAGKLWAWVTETLLPWAADVAGKVWAYLKENVPQWIKTIVGVLGVLASRLWEFITQALIPWAIDLIKKVWTILKEKGPGWWEKIKEILGTIVTALWSFITTDLIPWIADVIREVVAYVGEHGPEWLAKIVEVLGTITTALWNWITETVIPWLEEIISEGLTILGKIATDWWSKIKEGLDKIKGYFVEIFDSIKEIVMNAIKGAINEMIKFLEDGINKVIGGINSFIKTINNILTKVGIDPLGLMSKVSIPRLAKGGIALSEQLSIVGDVPEAIIPLDRLPEFMGAGKKDERPIHIEIRDNVVRDDSDIDRIVREVSMKLGLGLSAKRKMMGRSI